MREKGFSLTEVIVVVVIVTIIAMLGLVKYSGIKEQSLDKEAKANLKLIQAAQKIYHMEFNPLYYPSTGNSSDITEINSNLKLSLPAASMKWNYTVDSTGRGVAVRSGGARTWTLQIGGDEPTCTGTGCS
ncbi:MAG: prepilin-type N-terminal cleavage/methylation domain-containing protein [Candidatus Omnitrophica bacterium]|nr:prepilin-type N-terminal cleavage/methylation domain-containing protein [Candidatus Omnitrophota bacterium]